MGRRPPWQETAQSCAVSQAEQREACHARNRLSGSVDILDNDIPALDLVGERGLDECLNFAVQHIVRRCGRVATQACSQWKAKGELKALSLQFPANRRVKPHSLPLARSQRAQLHSHEELPRNRDAPRRARKNFHFRCQDRQHLSSSFPISILLG